MNSLKPLIVGELRVYKIKKRIEKVKKPSLFKSYPINGSTKCSEYIPIRPKIPANKQ